LIGASAHLAVATTAAAAPNYATMRGAAPWRLRAGGPQLRPEFALRTPQGRRTIGDVLAGRPAIVSIWASWCAPCLAEKPSFDALAGRLADAGSGARCFAVQAFDEAGIQAAIATHRRLGLKTLTPMRASNGLQVALAKLMGETRKISLPRSVLLDGEARLMGWIGSAREGARDLWAEEETFAFLMAFGEASSP
jgi:thiol-disulfide isomerase/thioredoxin